MKTIEMLNKLWRI